MPVNVRIFQPEQPEGAGPTVSQILDLFYLDQRPELCASTFADRHRVGERFRAAFGDRPYDGIRPSEVKAWILSRTEWQGQTTRWCVLLVLKRIFNWARKDRLISFNPLDGLELKKGRPRRATTEEEFQLMLRASDPCFRRLLVFLRATGCRPQDVTNLEWPWIDWGRGIAVIPPEAHKSGKRTGEPKVLVLTMVAVRLVLWLQRTWTAGERVFVNSRGQPWTRVALSQRLMSIRERTGMSPEATLHGIRHLWGTSGVSQGGSLKMVSQCLGHANVKTTEQYYLHLDVETLRRAAEIAAKRHFRRPK